MKKLLFLSLLLILSLSTVVFANEVMVERDIVFVTTVDPWADVKIDGAPASLRLKAGEMSTNATVRCAIHANFPWHLDVTTTPVSDKTEINNLFKYSVIGDGIGFGGAPGIGASYDNDPGIFRFGVILDVDRTNLFNWTKLLAGEYTTTATLTISAQ